MPKLRSFALAFASLLVQSAHATSFADAVTSYNPGSGFATEFGSGIGYTNPLAALGQPNVNTSFGAVQPFNGPFERTELVSLGTNGSLVVQFNTPILNAAGNPFGLDFIIYGSASFLDADYPNGRTDGFATTFSDNPGLTRVSISADGVHFFQLDPLLAPTVDGLWPTDGAGQFGLPVDPLLTRADFANKSLAEIRALYGGGAGGTGFDIGWARDDSGSPVSLSGISFIRVDVLTGRSEIDGFAAVVPEPATWALALTGLGLLCVVRQRG